MTRQDYFREARTRLEQTFVDHLKAEREAFRAKGLSAEEIEARSKFLWRAFEKESQRIIRESWDRYRLTFH